MEEEERDGGGGRVKEKRAAFSPHAVAVVPKYAVLWKSSSALSSASYILGMKGIRVRDAEAAERKIRL